MHENCDSNEPRNRTKYAYDTVGRLSSVTSSLNDAQHPSPLYSVDSAVGYYPSGDLRKASFGNGLTQSLALNSQLQPCRVNVNSSSAYFSSCADAVPSGNVLDFTVGYNAGSADNGIVTTWSATGQQVFTRSYGYDSLSRIQSMTDSASAQSCKGLSWTLDVWGNVTNQTTTAGTCYSLQVTPDTSNRLSGNQYDAAGNLTNDTTHGGPGSSILHAAFESANFRGIIQGVHEPLRAHLQLCYGRRWRPVPDESVCWPLAHIRN
jgi:YD repeat-containing protein